jgi:type VI secretion system secreted protein VgrG
MSIRFHTCAARIIFVIPFAALLYSPSEAWSGPILGTLQGFAVVGSQTVTNTGTTTIYGNVGLSPGSSITGFGTVTQTGTEDIDNGPAVQAQSDATAALVALTALALPLTPTNLTGVDLGTYNAANPLTPGVYTFSSSAQLTGTLYLNAQGNQNALFIFEIGSTLTTATSSAVDVINGGAGVGVFWEVGSSATLGTGTAFEGNIIAADSITLNTGASILCGRAIAQTGAVTLQANSISDTCTGAGALGSGANDFGSLGFAGDSVPEPGTVLLPGLGLFALLFWRRRCAGNSSS